MKFKCNKDNFTVIEMMLFSQEYDSIPEVSNLTLIVDDNEYKYSIEESFSKWRWVTK